MSPFDLIAPTPEKILTNLAVRAAMEIIAPEDAREEIAEAWEDFKDGVAEDWRALLEDLWDD